MKMTLEEVQARLQAAKIKLNRKKQIKLIQDYIKEGGVHYLPDGPDAPPRKRLWTKFQNGPVPLKLDENFQFGMVDPGNMGGYVKTRPYRPKHLKRGGWSKK